MTAAVVWLVESLPRVADSGLKFLNQAVINLASRVLYWSAISIFTDLRDAGLSYKIGGWVLVVATSSAKFGLNSASEVIMKPPAGEREGTLDAYFVTTAALLSWACIQLSKAFVACMGPQCLDVVGRAVPPWFLRAAGPSGRMSLCLCRSVFISCRWPFRPPCPTLSGFFV